MKTFAQIEMRLHPDLPLTQWKSFISYAEEVEPRLQLFTAGDSATTERSVAQKTASQCRALEALTMGKLLPRHERPTMMKMAIFTGFILFLIVSFSLPAYAQGRSGGAGVTASTLGFSGGGGGGFGGGMGGVSFHTLPSPPEVHYDLVYAQGSATEYVASTYVSFEEAVKLGKVVLAYKPKSIAQVAAECRAAKKMAQ